MQEAGRGVGRPVQLDGAGESRHEHLVDGADVAAGVLRLGLGLVTRREYVAVDPEQLVAFVVAEGIEHLGAQLVRPADDHFGEFRLDVLDTDSRTLARRRPHDRVQPRERRIGDLDAGIDGRAVERLLQDPLDALAHGRRITLAGNEDDAREKAPERVAAQEEPHPLAILQVQDADGRSRQVGNRTLEQLVARERVQDVQQRLAAVPGRFHVRALDDLANLVPQQGDVTRALAVSGRGEQADEAPFADRLARLVEFLDTHVVEVGVTVNRRARVRLGEDQPVPGAREALHFPGQLDGLVLASFIVRQQSEPAALERPQENLVLSIGQPVLAVAEKREMVVDHPVQQQLALLAQFVVDALRPELEQLPRFLHLLAHFGPVAHGHAHVGQDLEDFLLEQLELLRIGLLVDRKADKRLEPAYRLVAFGNLLDFAAAVSNHADDRVYGDVNGQSLAVDRREHGIDEKGHVVVDHLDEGESRLVAVIFERRVENPNERLPLLSAGAEFQVVERHARHGLLDPPLQVFVGHVSKVLAKEELDLLSVF